MANRDYDGDDRDYEGRFGERHRSHQGPRRSGVWNEEPYPRGATYGAALRAPGWWGPSYDPYDYRGLAGPYPPFWGGPEGWWRAVRSDEYGPRRGKFVGRGPKGYRRSDARIEEDVSDELAYDPDLDASDIEVRVNAGIVTLSGIVEDRHDKRLAEDLAERVYGIQDVNNELKVRHGLLARLTGEHADEREVPREAARDTETATASTGSAKGARAATASRSPRANAR